ncbi:MAG: glycerophosphodiester phosphodiesterase family protein [Candidatus Neomarinimicrobiota bacterium]|nr:glycerophosphodiester phosphodiesterase family protein [Candidatus Neomarinimicrobiota bacterium]
MLYKSASFNYLLIINIIFTNLIIGSENEDESYFDCPCPHIIAHQGSSLDLPPNTLEAFHLALDHGADIIELDIWRSKDGTWVVIHDRNLSRITGVNKDITKLTFEEIQSLDAGYNFSDSSGNYLYRNKGYKIPSLEQVFKQFNNEKINIEIKTVSKLGLSDLVQLIKKYQMEKKVLVVSFSYNVIKKFRKISNNQIATAASKSDIMRMIYFGKLPWYKIRFDAFQIPFYSKKVERYGLKNTEWIGKMRSKGMEVHYWTVDNSEDIKKAFSIGAGGVITNKPKIAYDLLVQMGKR